MIEYANLLHGWLGRLDQQVSDELLAAASITLLSFVAAAKFCMMLAVRVRPSILLLCADFGVMLWCISALSAKLLVMKTTPQHLVLHIALALYAVDNVHKLCRQWRQPRLGE